MKILRTLYSILMDLSIECTERRRVSSRRKCDGNSGVGQSGSADCEFSVEAAGIDKARSRFSGALGEGLAVSILLLLMCIGSVTFLLRFLLALCLELKAHSTYRAMIVTSVGEYEIEPLPFSPGPPPPAKRRPPKVPAIPSLGHPASHKLRLHL
jgi:hypothetical protein